MRRADKTQSQFPWQPVFPVLLLVALALLGWREYLHAGRRAAWTGETALLQGRLEDAGSRAAELEAELSAGKIRLDELEVERQSLADRAGNLEAQRDHLRAEMDRRMEELSSANEERAALRGQLEAARLAQLEAERLPGELQLKLENARSRIAELENRIDTLSARLAAFPSPLELQGCSADGSVFALSGQWTGNSPLPARVLVCRASQVLLEGWIHRREESALIGHVRRWESPASTLVKGEKVFILPLKDHEAD